MLTRSSGFLTLRSNPVPVSAERLQSDGYVVLDGVFLEGEIAALCADVERVFEEYPPDGRGDPPEQSAPFRYEMLNRSGIVQSAVGHPRILEVVEPLLGEDCHIIANTAWWQRSGENDHLGRFWHIDGGPHVPRDPSVTWDARIPYPVFAIAAHLEADILLIDEVLAVGDEAFQRKCLARIAQRIEQGTTLVLVSHDGDLIERTCERVIVLDGGEVVCDGPSAEGMSFYHRLMGTAEAVVGGPR